MIIKIDSPSTTHMKRATVIEDLSSRAIRAAKKAESAEVAELIGALRTRVLNELRVGDLSSYNQAVALMCEYVAIK